MRCEGKRSEPFLIGDSSIEAYASHEASCAEQTSRGDLERQKLADEKEAEKQRIELLQLQALSAAVESTGQAVAEAEAQAQKANIECHMDIEGQCV